MSAVIEQDGPLWPNKSFWDDLDRLETRHLRLQSQHELLRRELEGAMRQDGERLSEVWKRYCEVIAELDRTTSEFEHLRTRAG